MLVEPLLAFRRPALLPVALAVELELVAPLLIARLIARAFPMGQQVQF